MSNIFNQNSALIDAIKAIRESSSKEYADEFKAKALAAKNSGRNSEYHSHMATHHDHLATHHKDKGNDQAADLHMSRATSHEQKAKEAKQVVEHGGPARTDLSMKMEMDKVNPSELKKDFKTAKAKKLKGFSKSDQADDDHDAWREKIAARRDGRHYHESAVKEGRMKDIVTARQEKERLKGLKPMKTEEIEYDIQEQSDSQQKHEMAQTQAHFIKYAAEEIIEYIEMGGEIQEWYQNKLAKVHSDMESLHSNMEGEKRRKGMAEEAESVEIEESKQISPRQNLLLRAMATDPKEINKMRRAIRMGDKALMNPVMRQEILRMLDQMMDVSLSDPTLFAKTRQVFQKSRRSSEAAEKE